jgi:hypothetical protein
VKAIIGRYHRAIENVVEARLAFQQLDEAAPPDCVDLWKASIEEAESQRLLNPAAMDIMQSKIKTAQSLKQITAALLAEERVSLSIVLEDGGTTDWLLEGLRIEDEQYALFLLCSGLSSDNSPSGSESGRM